MSKKPRNKNSLSPTEQRTLEWYNQNAQQWHEQRYDPEFWLPEFVRFNNLLAKGKILDIGCGTGRDARHFINRGYDYLGIDISESMLAIAGKLYPQATFRQMNMGALRFRAENFDGFWAAASLLYVPKGRITKVLLGIKRVLKPSGLGFIALKEGVGKEIRHEEDGGQITYMYYSREAFYKLLYDSGFSIIEIGDKQAPSITNGNITTWVTFLVKRRN